MIKNSIVKRWAFSVLSGIIVLIVIIGVVLSVLVKAQYYESVRVTLNSRASSMVTTEFNISPTLNEEQFIKAARRFLSNFSDKNVMEVWIIDQNGNAVLSSSGFSVSGESYPDYEYAKASENGKSEWIGHMKSGEKVMALTYLFSSSENSTGAAVRYIISLEEIDNHLIGVLILIWALMLIVIAFVITSGAFFIRSIINPVKKINETASKIAKGDFSNSIEKYKYNDEIGQLCDTINNMAREMSETDAMKNEFISTVSHELRTPLTAIKGWGETVRSAKDDEEIVDKGISVIVSESERLSELVEELLDFSRMESGKMTLKINKIDLAKELSEVLEVFSARSEREGIELKTDVIKGGVFINADKNRLKQVFVNIIDNSFKYNKRGGYVAVQLKCDKKSAIVTIEDNGCGISKNDLPRVREKFFKANNSTHGNGIGLAVADEIIKLHGGAMLIDSKPGQGTKTTLIFPLKK